MPTDQTVLTVSDDAAEAILGIREREPDAPDLALSIAVTGVQGVDFTYELSFIPAEDAGAEDSLTTHAGLPVVVAAGSIANLDGAAIVVRDGALAIDNPNSPLPAFDLDAAVVDGDLATRVQAVLEHQINPAIASHGGYAELAGVDEDTVFLNLGGGCAGCGMAQATLTQGIEVAIKNAIPEITRVVDVTDHAAGTNPYYH
ncbi:MAG: NifU family protein [Actinobacteria bacterium]|nr:NifU family protein [Actinomycetota bacterium]